MRLKITTILLSVFFLNAIALQAQDSKPQVKADSEHQKEFVTPKEEAEKMMENFKKAKEDALNGPKVEDIPLDFIGASYHGFTLQVTPSQVSQKEGQEIVLEATIKNVSTENIEYVEYFGCPFAILGSDSSGNVVLNRALEGEIMPSCGIRRVQRILLKPGEMRTYPIAVTSLFDLKKGQNYTMVAFMRDNLLNGIYSNPSPYGLLSNQFTVTIY